MAKRLVAIPLRRSRSDFGAAVRVLCLTVAAFCCFGFSLTGCSQTETASPPVVLISIDTLRSDRLPTYGYEKIETPQLTALAADAMVFERAYSHYPMTLPSHASIFTGMLPPTHGVRDNLAFSLDPSNTTLAELLQTHGYRTFAAVSSMVLRASTGIAQGFQDYDDRMATRGTQQRTLAQRPGTVAIERATTWLDQQSARPDGALDPFFMFVHVFEPHTPYEAPEPFASRYASAYDAEVAYTDTVIGPLLDRLRQRDLYDDALIIVLSDHGEGLGDHIEQEHGLTLYREVLQVPLMIKLPQARRAGERIPHPVGLVDVMPTVLDVLGLDPGAIDGRSLLKAPDGEPIYSETLFTRYQYGWSELRSVIEGDLHYIAAPRSELFDMVADPAETQNLAPHGIPETMTAMLADIGRGTENTAAVSEADRRRLAALGYVGLGSAPQGDAPLPDPKDHIAEVEELWSLIRDPGQRLNEARIRQLLDSVGRGRESIHRAVARSLVQEDRLGAAARLLAAFTDSDDAETQLLLGQIATTTQRFEQAGAHLEQALQLDPRHPQAHEAMGILLLTLGRPQPAQASFTQATTLAPDLADAWNGLGATQMQMGNTAEAVESWQRAVKLDPSYADAWFNLALARRQLGQRAKAIQALEQYASLATGRDLSRARSLLDTLRSER